MLDAFKRASAQRITAVHAVLWLRAPGPQSGSARADQRQAGRRFDHDGRSFAHADSGSPLRTDSRIFRYSRRQSSMRRRCCSQHLRKQLNHTEVTIVSPDAGGVERARAIATRLDASLGDHR